MIKLKLKSLLGSKEITQAELSQQTGVRAPTISAICNNRIKELPISVIDKICTYLHCEPSDWIKSDNQD